MVFDLISCEVGEMHIFVGMGIGLGRSLHVVLNIDSWVKSVRWGIRWVFGVVGRY